MAATKTDYLRKSGVTLTCEFFVFFFDLAKNSKPVIVFVPLERNWWPKLGRLGYVEWLE